MPLSPLDPRIDLLYRLADDQLILGHRNSEWNGLGPILEEDIAFSSMAQDKLGHSLQLYTLLHEPGRGRARHRGIYAQRAAVSLLPTGGAAHR
ncbi:Phenylacetic acid catabolic protein [Hymenobacter humi]|uniref:Phenylacetic acid catabolic protein n=1 Tax=Hymenobacter humi TaxID=1411620 RepID=A0ABW2U8Q3_9BACT